MLLLLLRQGLCLTSWGKKKKESDAQLHITKISSFILVSKSKVNIDV